MQFLRAVAALLLLPTAIVASEKCARRPPKACYKDVVFELHDITYSSSYVYSTPAHLATKEGHVSFNITNNRVSYVTHCSASSQREFDFFYGDETFNCITPLGENPNIAAANFTFNQPAGLIEADMTWACGRSSRYLGYVNGKVNLTCKTDKYQNPKWTSGQIYSSTTTTCKPGKLVLPAVVFTRKAGNNTIIAIDTPGAPPITAEDSFTNF